MGIYSHSSAQACRLVVVIIFAAISFAQSQTFNPVIRTLEGTFQALIGHMPGSDEDRHQQFYLQTLENGTIALEIPLWLEKNLDISQMSGSQVTVRFTEKPVAGSTQFDLQVISLTKNGSPATLNDIPKFHRSLLQSSTGTAPRGSVKMIVFIMDLTQCGTAKPVVKPQVQSI